MKQGERESGKLNLWEQIARVLNKDTGRPSKKFYRTLFLMLLLGVGLLWLGSWFTPGKQAPSQTFEETGGEETGGPGEQAIISGLTEMIGQIKGVGDVKIFITLDSGSRLELVKDEERTHRQTLEEDSGGGSREVIEQNNHESYVILRSSQGEEHPLVIREHTPCYRGVLVVAEGVENPVIKAQVVEALKATLGLSYHRITVLPRGN